MAGAAGITFAAAGPRGEPRVRALQVKISSVSDSQLRGSSGLRTDATSFID